MNPSLSPTDFLLWESTCYDTVDFKKVYVDMTGDLAAGLLLSQIVYWHLPNRQGASKLRVQKGEHLWIAKRWDDWWAEVRLTEKQSIRAGEILVQLGIVVKEVFKFHGDRTVHLRLNWETFLNLWKGTLTRPEDERNAEPGERTKRPDMPRRAKHPNGTQKSRRKGEGTISTKGQKLQNALSSFCKTPFRRFAKRPFGTLQNALWGFSLTESTPKIFSKTFPEKKRGGAQHLESDPREGGQPSTPVAEPSSAAHSSSTPQAAPQNPTHEGGPLGNVLGAALASLEVVPHAAVLEAPDGVAADAAGLQNSQEVQDRPLVSGNEQATNLKNVPAAAGGGVADGASGAGNGAGRAGVDSLRPIDPLVLTARPEMALEGPAHKALRSLVGRGLPEMLEETTRTGGISRALWRQLDEGEIGLVGKLAQDEAKATGANMITLAVRGLDHLIGAVKAEVKPSGAKAAPAPGVVDPKLKLGARCTVPDLSGTVMLGVVQEVTAARYKIRFDDGNGRNIDRGVAAQLRTLRASDAPMPEQPEAKVTEPVPFAPVGSTWRPKDGGAPVTVTAAEGMNRTLSSGLKLAMFKLTQGFEAVPA